ncbi:2,3-dihydro-2,3-dihydroxybenzoate dehydrogenase [Kushneria marisflavi]|uniref:2,3-dihydro-2,3-dihydroxybenzoate dehydrogenase n=1 Tax=Kushneria marisflavi TaxID=157779 RepID=A0A240UM72_9GAMM|nr:2,3-dihydro-2,3-dihydroxybenzoate dehydrogenase [Kushneria marisflavi]ART62594.1 2,3-dihydro-2,3-dihydroxybenzoate dehydrogenase [Kushneria marisflavi]RKD84023.1 2,3-dihydro-2,3-dihydroxybenzoate dehydrogenase [Kushneria marisflavi]
MSGEFKGEHIVITGAARGIGATLARDLLEEGASVALLDSLADPLKETAAQLGRAFGTERVSTHVVDVSDSGAVDTAIADIEAHAPITRLAHVAGVLQMGRVTELTDAQWLHALNVNTTGVFNVTRAVARRMAERQQGAIVVVGSNAADTPRQAMGAYCASKAATHQLVRCLGLEMAEYNVRCNIVSPGSTDTDMQRGMWVDDSGRDNVIRGSLEGWKLGIPLRRIAEPEDVSEAIRFLLSDRARHITLHDMRIDGGATLGIR